MPMLAFGLFPPSCCNLPPGICYSGISGGNYGTREGRRWSLYLLLCLPARAKGKI